MSEEGQVRKDPGGKLNIALVYPNTYWLGMSNLGVHTLYRVFNAHPGIVCERFFTDHPRSIEAGRPLSDFPLIAFSVSYELDCVHMVRILMENKIPVRARERKGPIIIAGGSVLTMNPEPVAEALDVCFLGDGEPAAGLLYDVFLASSSREEFLERLEGKPGIYIPLRTGPEIACKSDRDPCTYLGPHPRNGVWGHVPCGDSPGLPLSLQILHSTGDIRSLPAGRHRAYPPCI
jgi:radical SAM superfamily enzyme YgiQ (UPF0313 family)